MGLVLHPCMCKQAQEAFAASAAMGAPRKLLPPAVRILAESPPRHHPPPPPPVRRHRQSPHQRTTSVWSIGYLSAWFSRRTSVFGLRIWVLAAGAGAAVLLVLLLVLCLCRRRRRRYELTPCFHFGGPNPIKYHVHSPPPTKDIDEVIRRQQQLQLQPPPPPSPLQQSIEFVEEEQMSPLIVVPSRTMSGMTATTSGESARDGSVGSGSSSAELEVSHLGWGQRYTRRELEEATNGLAGENVIGEGGYGIVYKGVLRDSTVVAIKNLHNNRGQAEKEFKVEVGTIGRVRHKNLVSLLGYCAEGASRMLVYEYVDNSNLEKWLHGDVGEVSPLTWDMRMSMLVGTARGLSYLHEGLEPKVVHRDIKSSNILLDRQWTPKVTDFGLAKLLCSERTYVTTRVMGTFGYVAPEYASTGMLNERSDVYSFGVLIMEVITGRTPVDYTRPTAEVNLVEWLKNMVAERRVEELVDPRLAEKPPCKVLKRTILAALRCVDPDGHKRPTMGQAIHLLEDDQLYRDERRLARELIAHTSNRYEHEQ